MVNSQYQHLFELFQYQMKVCKEAHQFTTEVNPSISRKDLSEKLRIAGGEELNRALLGLGYRQKMWEYIPVFEKDLPHSKQKKGVVLTDLYNLKILPYLGFTVIESADPVVSLHFLSPSFRYGGATIKALSQGAPFLAGGWMVERPAVGVAAGLAAFTISLTASIVTDKGSRKNALLALKPKQGIEAII